MKWFQHTLLVIAVGTLAGCSLFPNHRLDYQDVQRGEPLTVPANIHLRHQAAYTLPDNGPLLPADQYGELTIKPPAQLPSLVQVKNTQKPADKAPAPDVRQVRSVLTQDGNGYPMIMMHTRFAWAWEYVAQALKESDINIEDRNRSAGVFYVQLPEKYDEKERDARVKLSHTTNGIQVVAMKEDGGALLKKSIGHLLLAGIYAGL